MNRAELKTAAKQQIKGNIGILFVITLIIGAISGVAGLVLNMIPMGGLVSTIIITPAFTLSVIRVYLNLTAGTKPEVKDAFSGFDDFWAAFKVTLLVGVYTFLWSLLFVIPGIVKAYSYSMATYILAENKGKSARECIDESKAMTNGHKMDLFVLSLSFIGWMLLCGITFGIAYIWVGPYMQATLTNAYKSLKPVQTVEATAEEVVETPVEPAAIEETAEAPVEE